MSELRLHIDWDLPGLGNVQVLKHRLHREDQLNGSSHLVVDSHEMAEVDVSEFELVQKQDGTYRCESGLDIGSPVDELLLNIWVTEFDLVLIGELTEKVSSDFEIVGDTLDLFGRKVLLPKPSSNFVELISNEIQDIFPSNLISSVSHDIGNDSIFTSEIDGKLSDNRFYGLVIRMLRNERLETKAELMEIRSEHRGFV